MTRMPASVRAARSRSAVSSIEPSETTITSTASLPRPLVTARWIAFTFSTISSPPLYTGTTTVKRGRERDASELVGATAGLGDALGTLTKPILGASCADGDEVGVAGIDRRQTTGRPAWKRVVARAPGGLDRQPVCRANVAQCRQGDDVNVLRRLRGGSFARVQRKPVSNQAKARDVRQRERLVAEDERGDVVPA